MSTENQIQTHQSNASPSLLSVNGFEMAQRMATALSKSNLIPEIYRDNLPNCLIALEMANRMGASPMMVMQNLYIVHGKPAWSSQFIIAAINATKRFSPLRFEMTGEKEGRQCIAWAVELATTERLEGPPVSMAMAKAEGWLSKNGSKWQTMPELMLRYRAATFFGRLYAPEVLMGMREESEVIDVDATVTTPIPRAQIGPANDTTTTSRTVTVMEPDKPTPRAKGRKAKEETPPADEPEADKLRALLADKGYTEDELVKISISNTWCDTTAKNLGDIATEKLAMFAQKIDDVTAEIDELRASKAAAK